MSDIGEGFARWARVRRYGAVRHNRYWFARRDWKTGMRGGYSTGRLEKDL